MSDVENEKKFRDQIDAIAFDIDGTLYSSARFYLRIMPYFFRHIAFFAKYNRARQVLHKTAPLADFYEYQARLFNDINDINPDAEFQDNETIKESVKKSKKRINDVVYDGLKPYFKKTKPYKEVREFFELAKKQGLKLALLSDFPPEQKDDVWGLAPMCDVVMGSESLGALKPSVYAFGQMAMKLEVPNERILYVGNSVRADINGAKNAGMKTAYIQTGFARIFNKKPNNADISFKNYRQLRKIVLE